MSDAASDPSTNLHDLLAGIPDCVFEFEAQDGAISYISPKISSLTGVPSVEFANIVNLLELGTVLGAPQTLPQLLQLARGEALEFDFQIRHRDGKLRYIKLRGTLADDRVRGMLVDVSENLRHQQLSTVLMDSIGKSGQEILIFDIYPFKLVYANDTALENLNYELDELLGLPIATYVDEGESALEPLLSAISTQGAQESKYLTRRKDGSEYELVATGMLHGNNTQQLVLIGRDQTSLNRLRKLEAEVRDRYQRALNGSETDIWEWDIRNDSFNTTLSVAGWLNVPHEETNGTGETAMKYVHPADRERVQQVITNAILSPSLDYLNEYRLIGNEGEIVWIQARGSFLRDARGRAIMLSGTTSNITERKSAQRELKNQISTLAAVLENVADGILAVDSDGQVTIINVKAESILKRTKEELSEQGVVSYFNLRGMRLGSWSSVADGVMREAELKNGHGRTIPIEFAVSAARLVDRSMHIIVFRDISGRERFEKEILYAKDRAEYAAKAKTEFLATMSHEIRTPMNGILGMAQLLLDTPLDDEQFETARIIHSSGEALLTIINDVLDYSKIDAGKLEVESELFDLRTVIADVLEIVQTKSEGLGVPLIVDFPLDLVHRVYGDSGRVKQILLNLLGNAVKFTETGHIKAQIRKAATDTNQDHRQSLEISIEDTGIGIPKAIHDQLFESFQQADVSTTRKYGGTGLGLAICKRLVELMGGEIGFESEFGVGTRFWFRLSFPAGEVACNPILADRFNQTRCLIWHPNQFVAEHLVARLQLAGANAKLVENPNDPVDGTDILLVADQIEPSACQGLKQRSSASYEVLLTTMGSKRKALHLAAGISSFLNLPIDDRQLIAQLHRANDGDSISAKVVEHTSQKEIFDGLRILLAEDNIVNQKVISRMLIKQGCRVDIAANGVEAIEMWGEADYSLIFMDLRMPEKDGIETVIDIRQLELQQHVDRIPIVAMTANAMGSDRDACFDAGMDDYVSKPVHARTLTEVLQRWAVSA